MEETRKKEQDYFDFCWIFVVVCRFSLIIMVVCCICKINTGTLKITDGNPKYKGKPICKECQGYRKLLKETK